MASAPPPRPSQPPVPKPRSGRSQPTATPRTGVPDYPPPPRPPDAFVRPTSPPPRAPKRQSLTDATAEATPLSPTRTKAVRPPVATPLSPTRTRMVSPPEATPTSPAVLSPRLPAVLPDGEFIPRRLSSEITYEVPRSVQEQLRLLQQNGSPVPKEKDEGQSTTRGEQDLAAVAEERKSRVGQRGEVRLRSKSAESSGRSSRGGSPVYTDIDADLRRKSDYINVDKPPGLDDDCESYSYDEDDDDDGDDDEDLNKHGFTGFAIRGSGASGYQPSIKLRSHPALRNSLVAMTDDDILFQQARRQRRPKNRAPPPPPAPASSAGGKDGGVGAKKSKGGGDEDVASAKPPSGHKRSKSAQLLDSGSFGEAGTDVTSSGGRGSPAGDRNPSQKKDGRQSGRHLSPAPSPPPPAASSAAQRNSQSPNRGQRSPKYRSKSPSKGPLVFPPPGPGGSKSPKQKLQQSHSVDVASPIPTATPSASFSKLSNPPASKVGRGASNQVPSSSSSEQLAAGKKTKSSIPSRPPPPPGAAFRQNLPPKTSPAPAPPGHHAQASAAAASPMHLPSNKPKDVVRGHQEPVRGHQAAASASDAQVKRKTEQEPSPSVKPKRHAPPPPAGAVPRQSPQSSPLQARAASKEAPPPNYAEVMKQTTKVAAAAGGGGGGAVRGAASERGVASEEVGSVPPKPPKSNRQMSIDSIIPVPAERQLTSPISPLSPTSYDSYEEVLRTMDLLTIELRRGDDRGEEDIGLELVSGKVRSGLGMLAEGVFVRSIRRRSPAERDGRIQVGDMLVEVRGCDIRSGLDCAHLLLAEPGRSMRVKVGRPDITSSIFSLQNGIEEPIYTNQLVGTTYDDLLEKLERARVRADENERTKESALQELETYRTQMETERDLLIKELEETRKLNERAKETVMQELETDRTLMQTERDMLAKDLEETKKLFEQHKEESNLRTTELTQAVASISVAKTKSDSELECHREKLKQVQEQLDQEKTKAEYDLKDIRQKLMETQDKLSKRDGELSSKASENELKVQELYEEIAKHKEDSSKMWTELVAEKEKVTDLEERLKCTQADLTVEKALNARLEQSLEEKDTEISKLQSEVSELHAELADVKSQRQSQEASAASEALLNKPAPEDSPKPEKKELFPAPEDSKSETPMSDEDIPVQENGELPSGVEDSDKDDDAFNKSSPSPQVPCPYIDFVPLKEESPARKTKEEETKENVDGETAESDTIVETSGELELEGEKEKEEKDEPVAVVEEREEEDGKGDGDVGVADGGEAKGEDLESSDLEEKEKAQDEKNEKTKEEKEEEEKTHVAKDESGSPSLETKEDSVPIVKVEEVGGEESTGEEGQVQKDGEEDEKEEEEEVPERELSPDLSELIKPHKFLDNSAAVHRSKVSGVFKRKLPSREHLRKKDGQGDILHNMPEAVLSNLDTPLETTPEPEDRPEEDPAAAKSTPQPQPKPKPRAAPRKKPVATPDQPKEEKKPPQVVPRREKSVELADDSPKSPVSEEVEAAKGEAEKSVSPPATKPENTPSPSKPLPHVGPKPGPKRAPVPIPVARPRVASTGDVLETLSPEKKDPSKLTVKEKALLAQKVLMTAPDRPKPGGPPIPRKPKPTVPTPSESTADSSQTTSEAVGDSPRRGPASVEQDNSKASPVPRRKLPAGAFNIMGGVPMFGPLHTADRVRSATTSAVDHNRREESRETGFHSQEVSPEHPMVIHEDQNESMDDSSDAQVSSSTNEPAKSEDVAPPTAQANTEASSAEEAKKEPVEEPSDIPDGPDLVVVDNEVVLTWTPDVTVAWLKQVGLGSCHQVFLEKEIQGYMLFDIDGHKLKGMGITSHEDRNTFKKEIKNLKPFADKQKKLMEKQKKEEKRQAKKKKK